MDTATSEISPNSGSGQTPSQPTRLCQACLSVLTRDDLEVGKDYPHHSTLRALVEASNTRCYVCSWLLSQLWEYDQNVLRQLAEGRTPHHMIVEEDGTTNTGASDQRTELIDHLRDAIGKRGESVSCISFTTMRIEDPFIYETCHKISAHLNPSYEGYFPLDREVYDTLLKNYWQRLSVTRIWEDHFIITSYEGKSILTPTITR